ncbi:MAG TPA: hypothetical protein VGN28_15905 [Blastococcus sp.]|jgi:hypothetical protein|nr:hypothetical protein [Blastococcus sp.]
MAWLGIICLGMTAEMSMIILLGRAGTGRYEAQQKPIPRDRPDPPPDVPTERDGRTA